MSSKRRIDFAHANELGQPSNCSNSAYEIKEVLNHIKRNLCVQATHLAGGEYWLTGHDRT